MKDLVSSVRRRGSGRGKDKSEDKVKKRKNSIVNVEFAWKHFDNVDKKFIVQRLKNGGGLRKKSFAKDTTLEEVFSAAKNIFFPSGKNKTGWLSLMNTVLLGAIEEEVEFMKETIDEYLQKNCLKVPKFYLQTKIFDFSDEDEESCEESVDFAPTLENVVSTLPSISLVSPNMSSTPELGKETYIQNNLESRKRQGVQDQNQEYTNTLSAADKDLPLAFSAAGQVMSSTSYIATEKDSQNKSESRSLLIQDMDSQYYISSLETDRNFPSSSFIDQIMSNTINEKKEIDLQNKLESRRQLIPRTE